MLNYRANGKLLLTSEYAITQGAKGLAVPTIKGQTLCIQDDPKGNGIQWTSLNHEGNAWFTASLALDTLQVIETTDDDIANRLVNNLKVVQQKTSLLRQPAHFTTHLEFPNEWGLGSSSTFTSLLAQSAGVDSVEHFRKVHGGSGYDLACAEAQGPILYQIQNDHGITSPVEIDLNLLDDLGFVYRGNKQLTSESLDLVKRKPFSKSQIEAFNALTDAFLNARNVDDLEQIIEKHEDILSTHLGLPKVKDELFSSYPGAVKSLGGWGGDFVMVTRLNTSREWLANNGYNVVFPFRTLALLRP